MADMNSKPKIQLRSGVGGVNGSSDKSPSPATKLLINHGKPNFTIQRSPKVQNGDADPLAAPLPNGSGSGNVSQNGSTNNNYSAFKTAAANNNTSNIVVSTKFNGVFKPANIATTEWKQPHQQNSTTDNEAAKVVLRRAKAPEPPVKEDEDDTVPEFIRRQRRIQERLAKENVLDFESRRSGYFTHVMISPTSPNRTSFVETMSSPAIVPSLEIPPPQSPQQTRSSKSASEETSGGAQQTIIEETEQHVVVGEQHHEQAVEQHHEQLVEQHHEQVAVATHQHVEEVHQEKAHAKESEATKTNGLSNGHVEEEEVAKAIEEVNRAVAGEDEDVESDENKESNEEEKVEQQPLIAVTTTLEHIEKPVNAEAVAPATVLVEEEKNKSHEEKHENETVPVALEAHVEVVEAPKVVAAVEEAPKQNGHSETVQTEPTQQNGHAKADEFTISHTNGSTDGPCIPSPDPSGALGVNYEPKTVVSFSKDLGSEPNKYPDTVKVVKEGGESTDKAIDSDLQEMAKLKFDIKTDDQDVHVTSVLRTD